VAPHADIRTTERYIEGAVDEGAFDTIAALEASFARERPDADGRQGTR
jgi:hypothetical protein